MTWQSALWTFINWCGVWWDATVAAVAIVAGLVLFLRLILYEPWSALLATRVIIGFGFLTAALTALNSGWMKISLALFVLGGGASTILIATQWCEREDKSLTLPRALGRWMYSVIVQIAMTGPSRTKKNGATYER